MSLIYFTLHYTFFTGKLLVMGFAIINLILICSIDTSCHLMFSFIVIFYVDIHTSTYTLFILRKENCSRINSKDLYASNYKIDNLETFNKMFQL